MLMQDDNVPAILLRKLFQTAAEIQFFTGEIFGVKAADFSENGGVTENERACDPAARAAFPVPDAGHDIAEGMVALQFHGDSARQAFAGKDLFRDVREKFGAGQRIAINEEQPVAGGSGGAAISGATDLVHGLEDDGGTGAAGDFRSAVGRIIITNDHFGFHARTGEGGAHGIDLLQRASEQPFFIESGNDDGDFQQLNLRHSGCPVQRQTNRSFPASHLNRQNEHRPPFPIQPPLQREDGVIVQQTGKKAVGLENELAGKNLHVGKPFA